MPSPGFSIVVQFGGGILLLDTQEVQDPHRHHLGYYISIFFHFVLLSPEPKGIRKAPSSRKVKSSTSGGRTLLISAKLYALYLSIAAKAFTL
jgi:hypothetical protein